MFPRLVFAACLAAAWTIGSSAAEVTFAVTEPNGQPIADAVVSLMPLDAPVPPAAPDATAEIIQQKEEFQPYVTPVRLGTALKLPNRDKVKHQVYSKSAVKDFELPLYAGEAKEPIVFDKPGVAALGCNIHDWMIAYVVVLETPWFAKSNSDGKAMIASVPPGRYRAEIWQPRLKPGAATTREIAVAETGGAPVSFAFDLDRDRRLKRTLDAKSRGYK